MRIKQKYFGFIYEWIDSSNGKNYIGSHIGNIDDGYTGSGIKFLSAFKKRPDKFNRKILEYVFEDNRKILLETEQKHINKINWSTTYNISSIAGGGSGKGIENYMYGKTHTIETKQLQKEAKLGEKNHNYGKQRSEETRQKISESLKGRKQSEESNKKRSETLKGRKYKQRKNAY